MFAYNAYKLEVFLWHKGRKYVYKVTVKYDESVVEEVEDVDAAASVSSWSPPGPRSSPDLRPLGPHRYVAHPPVSFCVLTPEKAKQTNKSPHQQVAISRMLSTFEVIMKSIISDNIYGLPCMIKSRSPGIQVVRKQGWLDKYSFGEIDLCLLCSSTRLYSKTVSPSIYLLWIGVRNEGILQKFKSVLIVATKSASDVHNTIKVSTIKPLLSYKVLETSHHYRPLSTWILQVCPVILRLTESDSMDDYRTEAVAVSNQTWTYIRYRYALR